MNRLSAKLLGLKWWSIYYLKALFCLEVPFGGLEDALLQGSAPWSFKCPMLILWKTRRKCNWTSNSICWHSILTNSIDARSALKKKKSGMAPNGIWAGYHLSEKTRLWEDLNLFLDFEFILHVNWLTTNYIIRPLTLVVLNNTLFLEYTRRINPFTTITNIWLVQIAEAWLAVWNIK